MTPPRYGKIISHIADGVEVAKIYEESVVVRDRAEALKTIMAALDRNSRVEVHYTPNKPIRIVTWVS